MIAAEEAVDLLLPSFDQVKEELLVALVVVVVCAGLFRALAIGWLLLARWVEVQFSRRYERQGRYS